MSGTPATPALDALTEAVRTARSWGIASHRFAAWPSPTREGDQHPTVIAAAPGRIQLAVHVGDVGEDDPIRLTVPARIGVAAIYQAVDTLIRATEETTHE